MKSTTVLAVSLAVLAVAWQGWSPDKIAAQSGGASGVIGGSVTLAYALTLFVPLTHLLADLGTE